MVPLIGKALTNSQWLHHLSCVDNYPSPEKRASSDGRIAAKMPACRDEFRRLTQDVSTSTIVPKESGGYWCPTPSESCQANCWRLTATSKSGLKDFPSRMPSAIRMYSWARLKGSPARFWGQTGRYLHCYLLKVERGLHSVRSRTPASPTFLAHLIV